MSFAAIVYLYYSELRWGESGENDFGGDVAAAEPCCLKISPLLRFLRQTDRSHNSIQDRGSDSKRHQPARHYLPLFV
jgi:hypothetical protein